MLHATADLGLDTVTSALALVYGALVPVATVREVLNLGGVLPKNICLAMIRRVALHPGLFAMKEIGQDRGVMDVGSDGHYGVYHLGFAVDAYMSLHAEVPLMAFAHLMHVWIALLVPVLRRRRGIDDGGVDDRALSDLDAPGFQVPADFPEELFPQVVLLEQIAELQDGGLIRHRLLAEIDTDKAAHGLGITQRFFRSWIREVESLLEEINTQHAAPSPLAVPLCQHCCRMGFDEDHSSGDGKKRVIWPLMHRNERKRFVAGSWTPRGSL